MVHSEILSTAAELVAAHGGNAKFLVAERIDQALANSDGEAHDRWCLIGKAVALMIMTQPAADAAKPADVVKPVKQPGQPAARAFKAA
jgi:hypothetical protein